MALALVYKMPFVLSGMNDRTRFFVTLAVRYGVSLSALVFYAVACDADKHQPRVWTAKHLSAQLGLEPLRIRQLMRHARQQGLLGYTRTMRGFRVWATTKAFAFNRRDEPRNFYRLSAAKVYGYTGSVLLELLDPEPRDKLDALDCGIERGHGRYISAAKACKLFPWMKLRTVRRTLCQLETDGWLKTEPGACGARFTLLKSRWGLFSTEVDAKLLMARDPEKARHEVSVLRARLTELETAIGPEDEEMETLPRFRFSI